jgi:hypothetical protein
MEENRNYVTFRNSPDADGTGEARYADNPKKAMSLMDDHEYEVYKHKSSCCAPGL